MIGHENLLDFLLRIDYCVTMKKVLIISYYWPPAGGPGAQRNVKFVKYLEQFGWKAYVLTVNDGEFPYIDQSLSSEIPSFVKIYRSKSIEPFKAYKRLTLKDKEESLPTAMLTMANQSLIDRAAFFLRANLFVPDARIGWIPFAIKKARDIVSEEKIDLIYTSSPPHSLQLIGLVLKRLVKLPWVVDLRDPWTKIRYYEFVNRLKVIRAFDRFFERRVLVNADRIVTVSDSLAAEFRSLSKSSATSKISVLANGYDESDFPSKPIERCNEKFTVVYSGNMLTHQNPEVFWNALNSMIEDRKVPRHTITVELYGKIHEDVQASFHAHGLDDVVRLYDFIPHQEIVEKMKHADLLIMVIPDVSNNMGIVTGKLFEYLGSGKPILIIGPPASDAGKIIREFERCTIVDYDDRIACSRFINTIYDHWKQGRPILSSAKLREKYSRRTLTHRLTKLFDELI